MHPYSPASRVCGLAAVLLLTAVSAESQPSESPSNPQASRMLAEARARQPLAFAPNADPSLPDTSFVAKAPDYDVALLRNGTLVQRIHGSSTPQRMRLAGSRPSSTGVAKHAFSARDQAGGRKYEQVTYRNVYAGVDAIYHSRAGALEYDFDVAPRGNWRAIRLSFLDAKELTIETDSGALLVTSPDGTVVRHSRPEIYQKAGAERLQIAGGYRLVSAHQVAFDVGTHNPAQHLTIDPTINVTRFLYGNNNEHAYAVAVDSAGNSYITGTTASTTSFPAGTGLPTILGTKNCSISADPCPTSAFVVKLDSAGNIVATVLFGGTGFTRPTALAVDGTYVYVVGYTNSPTITTAAGKAAVVDYSYGTPVTDSALHRAFLAKFSTTLSNLTTVTTLSADGGSVARAIYVDATGSAYLTGSTCGFGFPYTTGAYQTKFTDGSCEIFVSHLDYFGSFTGYGPVYSARFGGYLGDGGNAIAVDATGSAWVAGTTCSVNFPVTPGLSHGVPGINGCTAFVTRLDASGSTYLYSLTFGGNPPTGAQVTDFTYDEALALVLNGTSGVYVAGYTQSKNFYTVAPPGHTPLQATPPCNPDFTVLPFCNTIGFVTYLDAGLNIQSSTFLGGSQASIVYGITKSSRGDVYVAGSIAKSTAGFPGATPLTLNPTGGYVTRLSSSLESVGWTQLLGMNVTGLYARSPTTQSTGLWTVGDRLTTPSNTDSFMVQMTDAVTSLPVGPICTTCVVHQ